MCPPHETSVFDLIRGCNGTSSQQCIDDNGSIPDYVIEKAMKALQNYILDAILDTNTRNTINLIPCVVHISLGKSGFVTCGAMLTLQDCDTAMGAIASDAKIGNTRQRVFAGSHFGSLRAKTHSVVTVRAENGIYKIAQFFFF